MAKFLNQDHSDQQTI